MSIKYCNTLKKALEAIKPLQDDIEYLEIDIETCNLQGGSALDPHSASVRLFQFNCGNGVRPVIDLFRVEWDELGILHGRLRDKGLMKLAHNAKFEYKHIKQVLGVTIRNLECTLLRNKIIYNGLGKPNGLKDVCEDTLGVVLSKEMQNSDWGKDKLSKKQIIYAGVDVKYLRRIWLRQEELMTPEIQAVWALEKECLPIFGDMELVGIKLNTRQVEKALATYQHESEELLAELQKSLPKVELTASEKKAGNKVVVKGEFEGLTRTGKPKPKVVVYPTGFKPVQNLNDFKKALKQLGYEIPKIYDSSKKRYREALTKDTVHFIKHPIAPIMADYNEHQSMLSKYLSKMGSWTNPFTGRVHTDISQILVTGRISMSEPPLQQIPKEDTYRSLFRAGKGWKILKIDYSQLELRILAEVTKDRGLRGEYSKGLKADLHAKTAKGLFKGDINKEDAHGKTPRYKSKAVNFGSGYGQGARGLMQYLWKYKIYKTESECQEWLDAWFSLYPGVKEHIEATGERVKDKIEFVKNEKGQILTTPSGKLKVRRKPGVPQMVKVTTLCGRPRFWDLDELIKQGVVGGAMSKWGRPYKYAQVNDEVNLPIQGTAGDLVKRAMVRVVKKLRRKKLHKLAYLVLQVHDELVLEVHESVILEVGQLVAREMEIVGSEIIKSVPIYCDASYGDTWAAKEKLEIVR